MPPYIHYKDYMKARVTEEDQAMIKLMEKELEEHYERCLEEVDCFQCYLHLKRRDECKEENVQK